MLTSSLGGSSKVNGTRVPSILIQRNGLLDILKSIWKKDASDVFEQIAPDKQEQVIEALKLYNEACLKVENEKYD